MGLFNKSTNPMFNEKNYTKVKTATVEERRGGSPIYDESTSMTVAGAVNKTFMLTGLLMLTAFWSYLNPMQIFMPVGALGAAGVMMFTSFKPHLAPVTAPLFAVLEGLFVGTVSAIYAAQFGGIIFQAVSLTMATLLAMLMIYKSGLIKVTAKFRMGVSMAVGAIMITYLISWIGSFAGFQVPFIHDSTPLGIGITTCY